MSSLESLNLLESFGIFWNLLEQLESFWNPLESFEILWNPLESFEILWNPLKSLLDFYSYQLIDSSNLKCVHTKITKKTAKKLPRSRITQMILNFGDKSMLKSTKSVTIISSLVTCYE